MLHISITIPVALVLYNYVLGINYFSSIHLSSLLIIIGIGADDIFVFHDTWKNSNLIAAIKDRPVLKLSYTFRTAAKAMFITSFTSAVAFLACSLSPMMPIRAFGIFSALIVPICFILTVTMQPMTYYIYEQYVCKYSSICSNATKKYFCSCIK